MEECLHLQDSDADEALSFCDLQLNDESEWEDYSKQYQQPSSDDEFFEFCSDLSTEVFPSGDIIFCGKLLSKKDDNFSDQSFKSAKNELKSSRSSWKDQLYKIGRLFDYLKLNKNLGSKKSPSPAPATMNNRIPTDKCDLTVQRLSPPPLSPVKPRQHLFMFGLMKFPPEMELRDLRNRQSRRSPASLLPAFDREESVSVKRQRGKSSWRLLVRALSRRGHTNAVVTASLSCTQHV